MPKGLESPSLEKQLPSTAPTHSAPPKATPSPRLVQHSSSNSSLSDSYNSPRLERLDVDSLIIADLVAQLPPNPKIWTPSQVALYLTHVLGLTPKPIVEDVTAYVRRSRMGGKVFLRLREKDLESEGLNLKWRKLMIEAVKKLRRDCLRGRIWGFEGGLQLPRQEDEMLDDLHANEEAEEKPVPVTAKGTLKRLRDKKAIRSMISSFENASQDGRDEEEGFVALGGNSLRSRGSVSSLQSNDSNEQRSRPALPPIYGKGFVKSRAESFTSLNESQGFKRKEITREELEHWFGSMSEQEAEMLANELQEDEELLHVGQEDQRARNCSSSSEQSSFSGESGPFTPPPMESAGFDLTPLNVDLVDAIVGQASPAEESCEAALAPKMLFDVAPLRRDVLVDEDTESYAPDSARPGIQPRPGAANGGKSNPYRSSTYEPEEMEALGLHIDEEDDIKFGTARKISRPPSYEEQPPMVEMAAAQNSIRIKKPASEARAQDVFAQTLVEDSDAAMPSIEHMRNMSAHEASGLSPYKPLSPAMSRKSSQRRQGEGEKNGLADISEAKAESKESKMATFGRKAGGNSMQLTAMLIASGMADGPQAESHGEDVKKAEDESEWGVTMSRKASRRGTLARNAGLEKEGATASRMAELFMPAGPDELNAHNLKELEKKEQEHALLKDHLYLPLTSLEPTADGKGSVRKRSMVLVERKRFESLARRMGVLESQLADLEAASLPPLSDLGSMANRDSREHSTRAALDEVFTIPQAPSLLPASEKEASSDTPKGEELEARGWALPLRFGAIPSYGESVATWSAPPPLLTCLFTLPLN